MQRLCSPGLLTFTSGLSVCFKYSLSVSKLSSVSSILTYYKNTMSPPLEKISISLRRILKQGNTPASDKFNFLPITVAARCS